MKPKSILWIGVIILFVILDTVLTYYGIYVVGLVEGNSLPKVLLHRYSYLGLILIKLLFTMSAYCVYRRMGAHKRIGIPIGLFVVGLVAVVWNLYVILLVV